MGFMRFTMRKLGRDAEHRVALMRNMVTSLIKHERIETTLPKAKELRSIADQMVTLAKNGSLHARRQAAAVIFEKPVLKKLFDDFGPRYIAREGGFTRIVKTRFRDNDRAPMAYIEYVDRPSELRVAKPATLTQKTSVTLEQLLAKRTARVTRAAAAASAESAKSTSQSTAKTPSRRINSQGVPRTYIRKTRQWLSGVSDAKMREFLLNNTKGGEKAIKPAKSATPKTAAPKADAAKGAAAAAKKQL